MMKKRILATLLCGVILASAAACNTKDKSIDQTVETTIETPIENPMENPTEKPTEKPAEPPTDIRFSFLSQKEKETWRVRLISVLAARDIKDYEAGLPGSYAVGLMDLDLNNTPEVLVAYPGGSIGNVFLEIYDLATGKELTSYNAGSSGNGMDICFYVADKEGDPVILEEGWMRALDIGGLDRVKMLPGTIEALEEDAKLLFAVSEKDGYYSVNGKQVQKSEYETSYQQFLKDHRKIEATQIQMIQWTDLKSKDRETLVAEMADALIASSQGFIDYTKKPTEKPSVPSDGSFVEDEGRYHRIIKKADGVYKLEIFDQDGKLVHEKESASGISCWTEDGDLLQFRGFSASPDNYLFYSVSQNKLSKTFHDVRAVEKNLVAYLVTEDKSSRLAVENIFDKEALCMDFECPKDVFEAYFAPDGKSVEVSFGSSTKPSKRVFCFENLPILKVTTICYVRLSASVQEDVYHVSSGHPALLRPANGDTVRLLETLEGGTYKDADGNERKDWHRILYRGKEMYVTADSFEVLTYEVK